jgi:hypothetical protein
MATLAIVEINESGEKSTRRATKTDLLSYHPRCGTCGKGKGIHGQEGLTMLFCQWAHKPVEREGYCSNHTELAPEEV